MKGPNIERHFFEQTLRHHVVRMIMRVDEAGQHELARSVNHFGTVAGRQVLP
jgi:hypothetical protein